MQHQAQAKKALEQSIKKLQDALESLDVEVEP
jgi:hypothetical protein